MRDKIAPCDLNMQKWVHFNAGLDDDHSLPYCYIAFTFLRPDFTSYLSRSNCEPLPCNYSVLRTSSDTLDLKVTFASILTLFRLKFSRYYLSFFCGPVLYKNGDFKQYLNCPSKNSSFCLLCKEHGV